MSQTPTRSPWPRRLGLGLAALLALDVAMLATAASIPAVREQARRFAPTVGSLVTAATAHTLAWLPSHHTAPRAAQLVEYHFASVAPLAPLAPLAPQMFSLASTDNMMSYSYTDGDGDETGFRYLYGEPAGKDDDGWSMSGTFNSRRMSFLRSERGPFVWFGDDDSEYMVRDRDLVAAAREITRPVRENGAEMGRIGGQQGRIGGQQGRLGGMQGALGARLGALAARRATAAMAGDDRAGDRLDDEIEEVQRKLERQSRELELQMRPLAREQERLGRIQSELGRKQEGLVKVETQKMRELLERAKREGKAVRLHADA